MGTLGVKTSGAHGMCPTLDTPLAINTLGCGTVISCGL
jgi:hypothetical protein